MSANSVNFSAANIVAVFPIDTSRNSVVIRFGNQQREFSRSCGVGAAILFKTKNQAKSVFENFRRTELCDFGRSSGKDARCNKTEWFVDIHGNKEQILPALERVFNIKLI